MMEEAVQLAARARPTPNPRVGAVLCKKGKIIGRGYHEKPGAPHAEIIALKNASEPVQGADLYVTLEPCVHTGRTGPCVDAIIQAGIATVYVGMTDPDERVNGRGIAALRNAGIDVVTGVLEAACTELLSGYITHRTLGRPHVVLKVAITLDGCIATDAGDSKWISCAESRALVHRMRAESDAVLVGIGTVLADDPSLTVRDFPGPTPLRVIMDSSLRIPETAKLLLSGDTSNVLLAYTQAEAAKLSRLQAISHVECLQCKASATGGISIKDLLFKLGERGILSLLLEGGRRINGSFLRASSVDEVALFIAPKIIGGGIGWTDFPHALTVADGREFRPKHITQIGDDLLYRATILYPEKNR